MFRGWVSCECDNKFKIYVKLTNSLRLWINKDEELMLGNKKIKKQIIGGSKPG